MPEDKERGIEVTGIVKPSELQEIKDYTGMPNNQAVVERAVSLLLMITRLMRIGKSIFFWENDKPHELPLPFRIQKRGSSQKLIGDGKRKPKLEVTSKDLQFLKSLKISTEGITDPDAKT